MGEGIFIGTVGKKGGYPIPERLEKWAPGVRNAMLAELTKEYDRKKSEESA